MFVFTKTFIPYGQFDLDIILKVTAAIIILNLAHMNGSTNPWQASYQATLDVLLFASVWSNQLGHCDIHTRGQNVSYKSPIGIHVNYKNITSEQI